MRALLVLYMVIVLKFGEAYGTGLYADYYGLIELGGVLGALLADRLVGIKRAILLGSWIMGIGHFFLAMHRLPLLGFGMVVVGSSLFAPNLIAHLGTKSPNRGIVGSIFLILNAGTYLATPLSVFFSERGVWAYGFWLASFGTMIATLFLFRSAWQEEQPKQVSLQRSVLLFVLLAVGAVLVGVSIDHQAISIALLPWVELSVFAGLAWALWRGQIFTGRQIAILSCYLVGLTLYYACEEHFTNQLSGLGGFSLLALNPVIVLALENPLDGFFKRFGGPFVKMALPFLIGAFSFALLPLGIATGGIGCISLGEIMIGSVVYWTCIESVPKGRMQAKIICLASIVFSLATSLGSQISRNVSSSQISIGGMALFLLVVGLILAATVSKTAKA